MSFNINSLSSYGNLSTYTKQLSMKNKFQQKKDSGRLTEKSETRSTSSVRKNTEQKKNIFQQFMEEKLAADQAALDRYRESENNRDKIMEKIVRKLDSGTDLTQDELEYVKEKNPQLYEKIMQQKREQQALEERLEHAKTKEEAEKIIADHVTAKLSTLNSVKNNPNIPEEKKLEIYSDLNRSVQAAQKTYKKFTSSGKFSKLPTEAEKQQVEHDEAEAKKAELTNAIKSDRPHDPLTEADEAQTDIPDSSAKKQKTVKEVDQSETARKVKKAKEQAVFKKTSLEHLIPSSYYNTTPNEPTGQQFNNEA